jgi:hypothetical protein
VFQGGCQIRFQTRPRPSATIHHPNVFATGPEIEERHCAGPSRYCKEVLVHLYQDRWRTRAWIFQEIYLSSTAMRILIRRKRGILARHKFGFLQGEICLNAVDFRKQATLFLLASKRESQRGRAKKRSRMLKRFGRYEIQYHFQHDARKKAMSPRILPPTTVEGQSARILATWEKFPKRTV